MNKEYVKPLADFIGFQPEAIMTDELNGDVEIPEISAGTGDGGW